MWYTLVLLASHLIIESIALNCYPECQECNSNRMYCQKSVLHSIPNPLPSRKVILYNQRFQNSVLTPKNFTRSKRTNSLTIRFSNIITVLPHTFSALTSLRELDLSENVELDVEAFAFANLYLNELRLDQIGTLKLAENTFSDLSVRNLSIENSHLLTIEPNLLFPISTSLKNLYLKHNLIRTINSQLSGIFQSLNNLELFGNPFTCDCNILWLSKILNRKALTTSYALKFPICASPREFRKQSLHQIHNKLTDCNPPKISRLDINFFSPSKAIINCYTAPTRHNNEDSMYIMQSTEVTWIKYSQLNINQSIVKHLPNPLRVVNSDNNQHMYYICKATNPNGVSSIQVKLLWIKTNSSTTINRILVPSIHSSTLPPNVVNYNGLNYFHKEVFSLFEMIFAIIGTLIITVALFLIVCCYLATTKGHSNPISKRKTALKRYLPYDKGIYQEPCAVYYETDIDRRIYPPPLSILPPPPVNGIPNI